MLLRCDIAMDQKDKLHLVHNEGSVPEPVSTVTRHEEARLLNLADTALSNLSEETGKIHAGDRSKQEHRKLEEEVRDALDKFERDLRPAA